MKALSDFQLISMAVEGNDDAFRALVERHCDLVFRIAFKWCGVKEDAEDIAQDVMMQLAHKIRGFKPGTAAFTTWLYRVTINAARDAQRRRSSCEKDEREYANEQQLRSSNLAPETRLAHTQAIRLLDRLPVKEREALFLVFCEGLNHKDAARIAGCAESTISWRVHSARKKLTAWARQ